MKLLQSYTIFLVLLLLLLSGCNTALTMGDRVVGVRDGKFFYTDGTLKADYTASFERTWQAAEKALQVMNATIMETEKKISTGTYHAHMEGEDIRITLEYLEPELTLVAVRVGISGNNLASRLIHDKIGEALR